MRYLFFLVLLVNVIFYFWHWRTEVLKPLIEPSVEELNRQILLLSEVNDPNMQQPVSANDVYQMICYEAGPFDNKQEILDWNKQNLVEAENIVFHFKDVEVVDGYLLFYPAPESLAKAEENVAILEAKGVNDLWLFRFGEMKGAISLGFYDTAKQAIHAQEILEKLGVSAKIKKHAMVRNHIFSRIIWKGNDQKIEKIVADFKGKFPDKRFEKCQKTN